MSSTIITSSYTVAVGQSDTIDATPPGAGALGYAFTLSPVFINSPSLTVLGSVSVSGSAVQIIGIGDPSTAGVVQIATGGSFSVTNSSGAALGYESLGLVSAASVTSSVKNDGHITITGHDYAAGFELFTGETFANTGTLEVQSTSTNPTAFTIGVYGYAANSISNTGTISVTGAGGSVQQTIGVLLGGNLGSSRLVNSGTIVVGNTNAATAKPAAVEVFGVYPNVITIENSGHIEATGALAIDGNTGTGAVIHLSNSGSIVGDVLLGSGPLPALNHPGVYDGGQIRNSGSIHGDVHLDIYGNDTYDGRGGTLTGTLYLGGGTDKVYLGDDGETVNSSPYTLGGVFAKAIVTGGAGNDVITGGSGIDVFDGGAGDDVLDGGAYILPTDPNQPVAYGRNTVSYASAIGGVTVSLGLQGHAQDTVSAGMDTLSNFQDLIGSAFADHLTGDANANVIAGGAGDDVLTGGGGADTFVLAPSGNDEVTDFRSDAGAKIDLTAFHAIHTLAQALAGATQVGADTVIDLGSARITLDNVVMTSLTAADFVFSRLPSDFGQSGTDSLLFRNQATGDWGFMSVTGSGAEQWHAIGASSSDYVAIGKGDFNGDGVLDTAFRQASTGDWGFLTVNPAGGETWHAVGPSSLAYAAVATGDILQDGSSEIVFRNALTGDWGFMQAGAAGGQTWHPIGGTSTDYDVIGSGDFNGDGVFDVAFRQRSTGDWGFLSINPGGGETWHGVGPSSVAYQAIGSASFLGDGDTQIVFRNAATGDWGFMQVNASGGETWHPIGSTSTDYDPIGVGDFNGDGVQDAAFRQQSTGDWGFLSINPGGGETWHHVGASSLSFASI